MISWTEIEKYTKQWIREAGSQIRASFQNELIIQTKSNASDFVTNIDQEIEQYFIKKINERFPSHRILGEEGYGDELDHMNGIVWIIDPIDGTMNFIHQQRNFAISIGIYENGIGRLGFIYDVVHDEMYVGKKDNGAYLNEVQLPRLQETTVDQAIIGVNATWVAKNTRIDPSILGRLVMDARATRSYGSATIEMAYVATSRVDAYISLRLSPWDFAGGKVIIEELGGTVTQLNGEPLNMLKSSSLLVAKPGLHEEIVEKYLKPYL